MAFAWKLASIDIPTVLVYLGFTGDDGMREEGLPFADHAHWREAVMRHSAGVLAPRYFERPIAAGSATLWILIRARLSPLRAARRRVPVEG